MSRLGFLYFAFLFFALPALRAEKIDNRNFAIDTFSPTQNEIRLAEQRARNYGPAQEVVERQSVHSGGDAASAAVGPSGFSVRR